MIGLQQDIYWLAGLLEGDGCFTCHGPSHPEIPVIIVTMYDWDIVQRALSIMHPNHPNPPSSSHRPNRAQPMYKAQITGARAAGWMMTVYPLMGLRRRARIRELLSAWKQSPPRVHGGYRPRKPKQQKEGTANAGAL